MAEDDGLLKMQTEYQLQALLASNQETDTYGLCLSREDAQMLLCEQKNILQKQRRIDFGGGILQKLISIFCDSPYFLQESYAEALQRLSEIFYLYKNESLDELTDDELLSYMKEKFDGECGGDMDYLEGTALAEFAREIRSRTRKYIGRYRADAEGFHGK